MNLVALPDLPWLLWSLYLFFGSAAASDIEWADYVLHDPAPMSNSLLTSDQSPVTGTSTNLSAYGPIHCLANSPAPGQPPYERINPADYYKLLEHIVVQDDALNLVQRTFKPGHHIQSTARRCVISCGLPFTEPGETTSPAQVEYREIEIAHVAAKIARACLVGPGSNGFGGYTYYGPNRQLRVVLGAVRVTERLAETA